MTGVTSIRASRVVRLARARLVPRRTVSLLMGLAALSASLLFASPETFEQQKVLLRELLESEDYRNALVQARSLQKEWPDDVEMYRLLGAASLGVGNYAEAEKHIQWMLDLRIGKSDFSGWLLVARFREATGDWEGALESLNSAHARASTAEQRQSALTAAGRIHLNAGRLPVADQAVAALLKENPDSPAALQLLARVRLSQGRKDEAIGTLRALAEKSAGVGSLYLLATLTKDPVHCASFELAARSLAGRTRNANAELALYLSGQGERPVEALQFARTEAARRRDARTLEALAVALLANGLQKEARDVIEEALTSGSRDPELAAHALMIRERR